MTLDGGKKVVAGSVVTVGSGGTATLVSGTVVAAGAAEVVAGVGVLSNATANFASQKGRVEDLKRTKHTDNRHVDREKYPEKSKYSKPNQVEKLENRTIKKPDKTTTQSNGRVVYEKDFKREIGTKGQTSQKVVVDPKKKKIITSYPQNK